MRVAWLAGWATPERWLHSQAERAWPEAEHVVHPASEEGVAVLLRGATESAGERVGWIVGYSLGSLLLLKAAAGGWKAPCRVALLGPVFAFPKERGLGGRIGTAEIRALERRLGADPAAALAGFYRLASLDVPAADFPVDRLGQLAWGLARLREDEVRPPLPAGWRGWCGDQDALLDAGRLREIDPAIRIVPSAGHHPAALIENLAREAGGTAA